VHALSGIEELSQKYPPELVQGVASLAKRFPSFFEAVKDLGAKKDFPEHVEQVPRFEWTVGGDEIMPLDPFQTLDPMGDIPCPSNHSLDPARSEFDFSLSGHLGKIPDFGADDPKDLFPF
jgi:hypothetical protein